MLVDMLPFMPWRVDAGTLDMSRLFTFIAHASLHLSGDTGSMHLAWLAGTASVTWMSALTSGRTWAPQGEQHETILSALPPRTHLLGVATDLLFEQSASRLRNMTFAGSFKK